MNKDVGFLAKYIKKYWKSFSLAVLFLTFEAISDLMMPTIMAKIIDVGVAGRDMDYVLKMGGVMLLITAFGAYLHQLEVYCQHRFPKLWRRAKV